MTTTKTEKVTSLESRALAYLLQSSASASMVGAYLWPSRTTRGTATQGGGDYKAQMFLGRLRKKGWARVAAGEGSSVWEVTTKGRAVMEKTPPTSVVLTERSCEPKGEIDKAWIRGFVTGLACAMEVNHDEQGAAYAMACARLTPRDLAKAGATDSEVETLRKAFKKHGRSWK